MDVTHKQIIVYKLSGDWEGGGANKFGRIKFVGMKSGQDIICRDEICEEKNWQDEIRRDEIWVG